MLLLLLLLLLLWWWWLLLILRWFLLWRPVGSFWRCWRASLLEFPCFDSLVPGATCFFRRLLEHRKKNKAYCLEHRTHYFLKNASPAFGAFLAVLCFWICFYDIFLKKSNVQDFFGFESLYLIFFLLLFLTEPSSPDRSPFLISTVCIQYVDIWNSAVQEVPLLYALYCTLSTTRVLISNLVVGTDFLRPHHPPLARQSRQPSRRGTLWGRRNPCSCSRRPLHPHRTLRS